MSGMTPYDAWKTEGPEDDASDPVECFDDCECSEDGYSCTTFKAGALEGGKYGFHGYHADGKLVPCKLCEGTGEYVPEVEEDFCEPDTDDDF